MYGFVRSVYCFVRWLRRVRVSGVWLGRVGLRCRSERRGGRVH